MTREWSVSSVAQSRKLERKPCATAAIRWCWCILGNAYTRSRSLSDRRACAVLSVARSALGYQSRLAVRDAPALAAMRRLAAQ